MTIEKVLDAVVGLIDSSEPLTYDSVEERSKHILDNITAQGLEYIFVKTSEKTAEIFKFSPEPRQQ